MCDHREKWKRAEIILQGEHTDGRHWKAAYRKARMGKVLLGWLIIFRYGRKGGG